MSKAAGYLYFFIFFSLILGGIIAKRVYGHPEFMMFFHLPAAVFLVLSGYALTKNVRKRYNAEIRQFQQKSSSST